MRYLVTGAAGFIGFHLTNLLLEHDHDVVGIDNLNDYYDVSLKESRLNLLKSQKNFTFINTDIAYKDEILKIFNTHHFDIVINLAAQAGVRYSISNPYAYIDSNINGFLNILEGCRSNKVSHLLFASSSSVYGLNSQLPFKEFHSTDHPAALYGATKKSNEMFAHAYSHLYGIPSTGLRFFTVYGPYGRPDMALFKFVHNIKNKLPIKIFNNGDMSRDFTYVADIANSVFLLSNKLPNSKKNNNETNLKSNHSSGPYKIYNIGNGSPVKLMDFINEIEDYIGIKAIKEYLPMQDGDVKNTFADTSDLVKEINFAPKTPIKEGIRKFIDWYIDYYD